MTYDYDYIIIGSGFGGSVSALRLSEKGYKVAVLEMGKRWSAENFPKTNLQLRKFLWMPRLFLYGMQQYTLLRHAYIAHGAGVGGGSLIYANTLPVPPSRVFKDSRWPTKEDWEAKLKPFYSLAKYMLGAVEAQQLHETDEVLRDVVDNEINHGKNTFVRHTVSVYYGDKPGQEDPDPFFNGEGPTRTGCIHCGECMSGCKHNAKNTLDKNYLYLAEKRGAEVIPETRVTDIRPLDGGGYEIHTECSTSVLKKPKRVFRSKGVVVSASVLGTVKLLLNCKERGSLPNLSDELGNYVRTNAEAFGTVVTPEGKMDHSKGIAITSGANTPDGTHVEAVRWGHGHDFLSTNMTIFLGDTPPPHRWLKWLKKIALHPIEFLKTLKIRGWAQNATVFMFMKPSDSYLRLKRGNPRFGPGVKSELGAGAAPETYMPVLDEVTKRLSKRLGGKPYSSAMDIFNICTTAHILGGATMGESPEDGVCDPYGRVYGYDNMYICDGSIVPANLTVNPSLTITALSEYVMSNIPAKPGAAQKPVKLPVRIEGLPPLVPHEAEVSAVAVK